MTSLQFREATSSDVDLIFTWANDPEGRRFSFHHEPIPYEDHVNWFTRKLSDDTCRIYIVCAGDEEI